MARGGPVGGVVACLPTRRRPAPPRPPEFVVAPGQAAPLPSVYSLGIEVCALYQYKKFCMIRDVFSRTLTGRVASVTCTFEGDSPQDQTGEGCNSLWHGRGEYIHEPEELLELRCCVWVKKNGLSSANRKRVPHTRVHTRDRKRIQCRMLRLQFTTHSSQIAT